MAATGETETRKDFMGFEYQDIVVKKAMQSVYTDGFESFGWIADGTGEAAGRADSVIMKFKRARKIRNKQELARLQKEFEDCGAQIVSLERSKTLQASVTGSAVGLIGTAVMAATAFAVADGQILLCGALLAAGLTIWMGAGLLAQYISEKKAETVNPLIAGKYEELYSVCKKADVLRN